MKTSAIRLFSLIISVVFAVSLAGCGERTENSAPAQDSGTASSGENVLVHTFDQEGLVPESKHMIWTCPTPGVASETVAALTDETQYPTVLARTSVLKLYIEAIGGYSNSQLKAIADFVKEHHLRVGIEVGGMKMVNDDVPDDQMGEKAGEREYATLLKFVTNGGRIDYITTDHSIADIITQANGDRPNMTLDDAIRELLDYFEYIRARFPDVKFGSIESLGYFQVKGENGEVYSRTVSRLKRVYFDEYLDTYLSMAQERGIEIDHFHIDYGYDVVKNYDGNGREMNFGRILAVENYCHEKGLNVGFIAPNAYFDASPQDKTAAAQTAAAQCEEFFDGYLKAGGQSDYYLFQRWSKYPAETGPETDPLTNFGIFKTLLENPLFE